MSGQSAPPVAKPAAPGQETGRRGRVSPSSVVVAAWRACPVPASAAASAPPRQVFAAVQRRLQCAPVHSVRCTERLVSVQWTPCYGVVSAVLHPAPAPRAGRRDPASPRGGVIVSARKITGPGAVLDTLGGPLPSPPATTPRCPGRKNALTEAHFGFSIT
jgi:hypothetical protein